MIFSGRRGLSVLLAAFVFGGAGLVLGGVGAHSGHSLDAAWATAIPTIDGQMTPSEWADAERADLGAIPGNIVPAFLLVKANDTFLWLAYDAVGDRTNDSFDFSSFAIDTTHDAVETGGREDQFLVTFNATGHYVYNAAFSSWEVHEMPFDESLPLHQGLAGSIGFASSDLEPAAHRIYEFRIPLALLGAGVGDTLGLFGGSQPAPGVYDESAFGWSTWPTYVTGPIPLGQYGDLNLPTQPGPVGVSISPSSASALGAAGTSVWYNLTVTNRGTNPGDTFDLTSISVWPIALLDATLAPFADTDADTVPDTGNLTGGASKAVVVRVDIPISETGCAAAMVTATSSLDTAFLDVSNLTTCVSPATFAPPHSDRGVDTNGNGFYDILELTVNVEVSRPDLYYVTVGLYDGSGTTPITSTYTSVCCGPGVLPVILDLNGMDIYRSAINGPYFAELSLYDASFQLIDQDAHTTAAYNYTSFEPPAAEFTPPHADRGVDTDAPPNGKYDVLALDASVRVSVPDVYVLGTYLFDQFGNFLTSGYARSFLNVGANTMTVLYEGRLFYDAAIDGPYFIDMFLVDDFGFFLDSDSHVTGAYLSTDFDPPPITFAPPHADTGVDTDAPPDGLFDWLVVSANVLVSEAGNYTVDAYLYGPGGFPFLGEAEVTGYFDIGAATVDLAFSGPLIRRAGVSGNYEAFLVAYPTGGFNVTDYDLYITGFYDFRNFQPPAGLFAPPHGDRAIDASDPPDGKYDWLEIVTTIDVTKASRLRVEGYLTDRFGNFVGVTSASADLPLGVGTIALRFDGHAIEEAAGGGPFTAYLELYDDAGTELDFGVHTTRAYAATDFQPRDLVGPTSAASVAGYWKNSGVVRIPFAATDPSPSDGLASVTLVYRYSPNNTTWFPWTPYETKSVQAFGDAEFSGSFLFDLPDGEGYYEFFTVARDYGGNAEATPAQPDGRFGAFLPARVSFSVASTSLTAGTRVRLDVRVENAAGDFVPLESPMTIALLTSSGGGEFRLPDGTTPIVTLSVPPGASFAELDYLDSRAGTATLRAVASGVGPGTMTVSVLAAAAVAVELAPTSVGLPVQGTAQFDAIARDAFGNEVTTASFAWAVSGEIGAITSAGVFTAGTRAVTGTVTVESGGFTATATVAVLPGPLDRLEVIPPEGALTIGGVLVLHVRGLDAHGNVISGLSFAWSVEGPGTLSDASGDTVIVEATGAGTITVTITAGAESAMVTIPASAPERPAEGLSAPAIGAGGALLGLVAGLAVGWLLARRRKPKGETTRPEEPPTL